MSALPFREPDSLKVGKRKSFFYRSRQR